MSAPPKTPDGEPEQRATDAPPVDAAHESEGRMEPGAPAAGPAPDMPQIARSADQPRRRRRRRRRPRLDPAGADRAAPAESPAAPPQALGHQAAAEGSPTVPAEEAASPQPTPGTPPRKRRRRRRRPPPEGSAVQAAAGEPTAALSGAAVQPSSTTERKEPRRSRAPRRPDGPHRTSREERPRERNNRREQSSGPRADADRGARGKRDKRSGRGPTDRARHRDREEARNKPAPKLHHLETVVDRGFEDVPDPATEGATRRADWTILKRTTADQRTARAVSMIYVLRRDGVETEFAQLSAARAAVNKVITHPEKMTTSKADHAAARGAKK
jgi:hypothetical protein